MSTAGEVPAERELLIPFQLPGLPRLIALGDRLVGFGPISG
jgi:hypothetical protein